ncbi:MAG: MFS transporter [Chloroflexota bacterium]
MAELRARTGERAGIFYGWWVLLAGMALTTYGAGLFQYSFGVFFRPISTEFGWSRAATAGAFSMSSLEGGIEGPIVGPLIDRLGPRKMIVIGILLMALGFLALSQVNSLLAFYFVYVVLLGIGYNTGFHHSAITAVANWFVRRRTLALGLLTCAIGLGGTIMAPTTAFMVGHLGWRGAAIAAGIGLVAVCLPLALLIRHKPEQYGLLPDGDWPLRIALGQNAKGTQTRALEETDFTVWEVLRTRVWWQLSIGFALRGLGTGAVIVHQVPLLIDRGIDPQTAANTMGLLAFMSLPGRLLFGFLGDMLPKRVLIALTCALQGVALLIFANATSMEQVYFFLVVYGLGWGASPLLMSIRGEYFGRKNYGTIAGFQQAVTMTGHVAGPVFAGWVFDVTGDYRMAFAICAGALFAGAIINFFAKPPAHPSTRMTAVPGGKRSLSS